VNKISLFCMIFLLAGCAHKTPRETKPLNFIVISPLIKLNDAGFIHNFKNTKQIDLYSSGISLAKITIKKDQICLNNACDNELIFNKKFFAHTHHNGFFANLIAILMTTPPIMPMPSAHKSSKLASR